MFFKSQLSLLFICIFLLSCKQNHKNTADSSQGIKTPAAGSVKRKIIDTPNTDTIFKEPNVIVIGSKLDPGEDAVTYVAVKFKPYIRFTDFIVQVESGLKKAPIQFSSNPLAREFRTRIAETYKNQGVNFGGHYCFAYWGCGSDCQSSVLIDTYSGAVYDGPDGDRGYKYQRNSRMLLVSPPDSTGFYVTHEPRIYIWNEKNKKFEQR